MRKVGSGGIPCQIVLATETVFKRTAIKTPLVVTIVMIVIVIVIDIVKVGPKVVIWDPFGPLNPKA